jgi:hypothetical protein
MHLENASTFMLSLGMSGFNANTVDEDFADQVAEGPGNDRHKSSLWMFSEGWLW